ncbi:hypothetical protein ACWHLZ_25845 [Streptomyces chartreusis]|jgi:hypothetical protein|uniref:hypothetical protein n=1 Tax=Streptomyces TaxID=1883 RepID=UPI0033C7FF6B|nr:hypothetical protein OG938_20665 [Streptomyces chartreusis]WTA28988.1 hypothetical protein OIA45_24550 [Streptomyces chartreusis]
MATLHERKTYREAIMKTLYEGMEGSGLPDASGAKLRDDLAIPEQDLTAACTYLVEEGLVTVRWAHGDTPATVMLTHQGIRIMEAEEEDQR